MKSAFIIAAVSSGVGKTTITLGLISALKNKGLIVQPFKIGPDFIDTGLHKNLAGRVCWNIDRFLCGDEYLKYLFYEKSKDADVSIIEGVMGILDGGSASTLEVAKLLNLPVILVVDVGKMAETTAAIVKGIESVTDEIKIAGVILNKIASKRHFSLICNSLKKYTSVKILGALKLREEIKIPHRHLGLYTAEEGIINKNFINLLLETIEESINIKELLNSTLTKEKAASFPFILPHAKGSIRVSVAYDKAFCFYYEDNFELLKKAGAELVFFSPLKDKKIPENTDFLYIGGGYPEIYANELMNNFCMKNSIKNFILNNNLCYAECGGFIYLTKGIYGFNKDFYPMIGIFPTSVIMQKKVKLGYREITLKEDTPIGIAGNNFKGHEFHYSEIEKMPSYVKQVYCSKNTAGYLIKNCLGSYVHIHFASNIEIIEKIVNSKIN